MANICCNTITFSGDDLSPIRNLIDEIKEENDGGYGWLPDGLNSPNAHCLFDVDVYDNGHEVRFDCWSKWSPPTEEILHMVKGTKISFSLLYDEMGMGMYGITYYDSTTETLNDTSLNDDDFERVTYDEESDEYLLDGEYIESQSEGYYDILMEKVNKQPLNN
jgi:hypothetical protein